MKKLILLFGILAISIWFGTNLVSNPGHVVINVKPYLIEMPLWFAIASIAISFLGFYYLLRLLHHITSLGRYTANWQTARRLRKANAATDKGLLLLSEGNWQAAEKHLKRGINHNDNPLINYLALAKSADSQGADQRRDNYLHQAQRAFPNATISIEITHAELQIENKQYEQALVTLQQLHEQSPKHPYILNLLQKIYLLMHDWQNLNLLLPKLKRYNVLTESEFNNINNLTYRGILHEVDQKGSLEELHKSWDSFPHNIKLTPVVLELYIEYLLRRHDGENAEYWLRKVLNKNWDHKLIALYGSIQDPKPKKQLSHAENWLKSHANDSVLLLTLGKLCIRNQLWGKAKTYLENSLALNPQLDTYTTYTALLDQLGESTKANRYYREALSFMSNGQKLPPTALPHLTDKSKAGEQA